MKNRLVNFPEIPFIVVPRLRQTNPKLRSGIIEFILALHRLTGSPRLDFIALTAADHVYLKSISLAAGFRLIAAF